MTKPKNMSQAELDEYNRREADRIARHKAKKREQESMPELTTLAIQQIRTDGGTQSRAANNQEVVKEYTEAILAGVAMPALIVFFDGKDHWLADGFQRREAYQQADETEVLVEVKQGSVRDAILYSVGANATHGLRRTNADKKRAVERLLSDEEWGKWSDRAIAEKCGVSHNFVGEIRRSLSSDDSEPTGNGFQSNERTGRDGRTINTANIGKKPEPEPDDEALTGDDEDSDGLTTDEISEGYSVPAVKQTGVKPTDEAPANKAALPDDDLTDQEYLQRCLAYRHLMQFAHKGIEFKRNALAYRAMSESVPGKSTLLGQVKHSVSRLFDTAASGPFYDLAHRFASVKPPQEWALCVKCRGKLVVFADTGDHTGSGPEIICKNCTGGYTL